MRTTTLWCLWLLAGTGVFSAPVCGTTWEIDPAHSSVSFKVRHMMVSNVMGHFPSIKGTFSIDDNDITKLQADATIQVASVDTRDKNRDEHLRKPDFFDVGKFPTITFKSKSVVKDGDNSFKFIGDLTIRGVTKEVTLQGSSLTPLVKDPWGNSKRGFSATTKLNRQDFGVSWNKTLDGGGLVIGNDIDIAVDLELNAVNTAQPAASKSKGAKRKS